eukprot:scaffold53987_cov15-Tisochrysis_lutea.AAC.1
MHIEIRNADSENRGGRRSAPSEADRRPGKCLPRETQPTKWRSQRTSCRATAGHCGQVVQAHTARSSGALIPLWQWQCCGSASGKLHSSHSALAAVAALGQRTVAVLWQCAVATIAQWQCCGVRNCHNSTVAVRGCHDSTVAVLWQRAVAML